MKIYLLGNGFDLHHKFPTNYIDFLHTIQFLVENQDGTFSTVGSVFGNQELHKKVSFIKECYEQHSDVYNLTELSHDIVLN